MKALSRQNIRICAPNPKYVLPVPHRVLHWRVLLDSVLVMGLVPSLKIRHGTLSCLRLWTFFCLLSVPSAMSHALRSQRLPGMISLGPQIQNYLTICKSEYGSILSRRTDILSHKRKYLPLFLDLLLKFRQFPAKPIGKSFNSPAHGCHFRTTRRVKVGARCHFLPIGFMRFHLQRPQFLLDWRIFRWHKYGNACDKRVGGARLLIHSRAKPIVKSSQLRARRCRFHDT